MIISASAMVETRIPNTSFTLGDAAELARLLEKIPQSNWFIPEPAFVPLHQAVSIWAPELVIIQNSVMGKFILLTKYETGESPAQKFFGGKWHIPGGYNRCGEEDIQITCSRIALRELGVDVVWSKVLDAYKWKPGEHPYGRPLSLFLRCEPTTPIEENDCRKFFNVDALPEPLVPTHRQFIETKL